MSRLSHLAIGCGILAGSGLLLIGWAFGASIGQSPREVTEQMIGVSLPNSVKPEVRFSGLLGPIPTNREYIAHVRFSMSLDDLETFVNRLGCPYPTKENRYECYLTYEQGPPPDGRPPMNGTAEFRFFQFRFREDKTVLVQIRLLAT